MKTKLFFIIVICFLLSGICNSQYQQWAERYQGIVQTSEDYATAIAIDNTGNSYITGHSGNAIATVKYDASGNQLWAKRYVFSGSTDNIGNSITLVTINGSNYIYVTGYTKLSNQTTDYITLQYDDIASDPDPLWDPPPTYNGPGNGSDYAWHIEVDASGNAYVTGASAGSGTGPDYATIKYDVNGIQQWVARYNGPGNGDDYALSLKLDLNGNVYVTGRSDGGTPTGYDIATVAYDNYGNQLWARRYNGPSNLVDYGNDIAVYTNYGVYVTGLSEGVIHPGGEIYPSLFTTIKYDVYGTQQWVAACTTVTGESNSIGLFRRTCSGIYGPCYTMDVFVTGVGNYDDGGKTIKYDDNGVQQWVASYPSINSNFRQLAVDQSENVYVTGSDNSNYLTVKYDKNGVQQWDVNNTGDAGWGQSIRVDGNGNTYVTGSGNSITFLHDYLTIKYIPPPCCGPNHFIPPKSENSPDIPETFGLNQNYPNPFNPSTEIKYALPKDAFVTLKVFNLLGQEIATLVNKEYRTAGYYNVIFDGSKYASGVYIYRIEAGSFVDTKKMVLIK